MRVPNFLLDDKTALVTGASRGIGQAIAVALASAGAHVLLTGRDVAALTETQKMINDAGGSAEIHSLDVGDPASIAACFEKLSGPLDILVNNAGMEEVRPALDVDTRLWDRILGVNLRGSFFCAQAAARRMIEAGQGGAILNLCSLTSEVGVPTAVPYGASKTGLVGMTRALAAEWAPNGIRVNGIGPGYFRTALTEPFYADASWKERMLTKIPLARFGRMEDLMGPAVFLCSDAAAYITGQVLYVDGGILAAL
ncbi:MAG TPA: glucose 1-dehydrogenase [Acidisoma sp.]|uniref:SDR family NAD(P)-dependent oxidoreductase n=1 Tax=Acidisoma sp. TaxID=1872115 RepID=UPI002C9E20A1|nr:glucose 1-dehydrogenase [Acidisoma sp.]HTI03658.1 glucose 1-dehydrogenase [Acidisoma sp.]